MTNKELLDWVNNHNFCSENGGLWLSPEALQELERWPKKSAVLDSLLDWTQKHNAFNPSWGVNIESLIWQPKRRELLKD